MLDSLLQYVREERAEEGKSAGLVLTSPAGGNPIQQQFDRLKQVPTDSDLCSGSGFFANPDPVFKNLDPSVFCLIYSTL